MKIRKLKKEDIRKFQVEEGQIGIRLDRAYQNIAPCRGCGRITMEDVLPAKDGELQELETGKLKTA